MVQPGGIYDHNDLKFLILYVLDHCKDPISPFMLGDIMLNDELVDFFDFSTSLQELTETGHVVKTFYHEQEYYTITPLGMETISLFSNRLKYHVRKASMEAAQSALKKMRRGERIWAQWFPLKNGTYMVALSFFESGEELLSLKLQASSKEQAKQICDNFYQNAESIVPGITGLLFEKKEEV